VKKNVCRVVDDELVDVEIWLTRLFNPHHRLGKKPFVVCTAGIPGNSVTRMLGRGTKFWPSGSLVKS
jgi:hypothetical protein